MLCRTLPRRLVLCLPLVQLLPPLRPELLLARSCLRLCLRSATSLLVFLLALDGLISRPAPVRILRHHHSCLTSDMKDVSPHVEDGAVWPLHECTRTWFTIFESVFPAVQALRKSARNRKRADHLDALHHLSESFSVL